MADDEDIAALVIDNGSGMCKGELREFPGHFVLSRSLGLGARQSHCDERFFGFFGILCG